MQKAKNMVEDIIRQTMAMLERQGYDVKDRRYNTVYRTLARFSNENYNGEYSHEIGEAFIASLCMRTPPLSMEFFRSHVLAVERANHVLEGDTDWYPQKRVQEYAKTNFPKEMADYEEYLRNSGKTKSDVRSKMHIVSRFLHYLGTCGITKIDDIAAQHIYDAFQNAGDKIGFHKSVSAFLQYAFRHRLITKNLSILVPAANRHPDIPTVYTPEEVETIIEFSSHGKVCGKRNRVIVLIAARLGLRSCDIANLRFENISYERKMIDITQLKTGEPLEVPLLPEIRDALKDYVENERKKSESDYVFLRSTPPLDEKLEPHTIYAIVSLLVQQDA